MLAYDEETGEKAYKEVVRLFRNETKEWYHIHVDGEEIVCTGGHPFYVAEFNGFVPARELKPGKKLLLSDGKYGIIVSVKIEELEIPETTYNFEVEDFHTYYVGENPVCVHNANCSVNQMNKQIRKGQAPKGVKRIDKPLVKGEQIHAHLDKGSAINIDGTLKHGNGKEMTSAIKNWLKGNGWDL